MKRILLVGSLAASFSLLGCSSEETAEKTKETKETMEEKEAEETVEEKEAEVIEQESSPVAEEVEVEEAVASEAESYMTYAEKFH
ncbi:hypothetical protein ACOJQI_21005 [Bacillus salacetis]|uniref:hypothetical protein n=1 Tax=Bacillus salacetis TaxID=2315464 RepID=UPI003B9F551C